MSFSLHCSFPTSIKGYFIGSEANCPAGEYVRVDTGDWYVRAGRHSGQITVRGSPPTQSELQCAPGFPKRPGTWHYVSVIMSFLNTGSEITRGAAAYYYTRVCLCDLISFKNFSWTAWVKENMG